MFSAIVTAFFVPSLTKLQPDETSITNDLLKNLTELFLHVQNVSFASTGLPIAVPFEPKTSDVRENAFWSVSLAMSVSQDQLVVLLLCQPDHQDRYPLQH